MTDQTIPLAHIGVKTIAILAFSDWEADTCYGIADVIAAENIDLDDKEEIRDLCHRHGIEPSDYGDTAPSVTFGSPPAANQGRIEKAVRKLHDATTTMSADDEQKAARELIDILADAAGVQVK